MRLKSTQAKDSNSGEFEASHFKEEITRVSSSYEEKLKEVEGQLNFEKERNQNLKKKIERYEI